MKVTKIAALALSLGLWTGAEVQAQGLPTPSIPQASTATNNQDLADAAAKKLSKISSLLTADVSVFANNGVLTVTGNVKDATQKTEVLEAVRVIPGVKLVRDGLNIGQISQTQIAQPAPGPMLNPAPSAIPPSTPMPMGGMMGGPLVDPVPIGPGGNMGMQAPNLPPYAWPTYAPYNNVSRVAYPEAYPYNAFPFIGPYYPFPKVPLGWRKVTLEWDDGHWWIGRKQAPVDYWRVRFW